MELSSSLVIPSKINDNSVLVIVDIVEGIGNFATFFNWNVLFDEDADDEDADEHNEPLGDEFSKGNVLWCVISGDPKLVIALKEGTEEAELNLFNLKLLRVSIEFIEFKESFLLCNDSTSVDSEFTVSLELTFFRDKFANDFSNWFDVSIKFSSMVPILECLNFEWETWFIDSGDAKYDDGCWIWKVSLTLVAIMLLLLLVSFLMASALELVGPEESGKVKPEFCSRGLLSIDIFVLASVVGFVEG